MADREIDGHKLHLHPGRVAEWETEGDCSPIKMEIGVTDSCNHRCTFCALDSFIGDSSRLSPEVLTPALWEMSQGGVRTVYFAGEGEPLCHPNLPEFAREAHEAGMGVALSTNGSLFTPKKAELILPHLSWMRFSVDAGTAETHAKLHGTNEKDFGRVINNIEHAARINQENGYGVDIGTQAVLLPENQDEMIELAKIIEGTGAHTLQIKPYSQHPLSGNSNASPLEAFSDLKKGLEGISREGFDVVVRTGTVERIVEGRDYDACHGTSFSALLTAKGDIIPCNIFYGNPGFSYGNLNKQGFSEIWTGEKREEVITKLKESLPDNCREACPLDRINRYLDRVKNPDSRDGFI
jgi:GTP 3',8-cyclase